MDRTFMLEVAADIRAYQQEFAKIEGFTDKTAAAAALRQVQRNAAAAEKMRRKQEAEAAKAGAAWEKTAGGLKRLAGAAGMSGLANDVEDLVEGFGSVGIAAGAAAVGIGAVVATAAGIAKTAGVMWDLVMGADELAKASEHLNGIDGFEGLGEDAASVEHANKASEVLAQTWSEIAEVAGSELAPMIDTAVTLMATWSLRALDAYRAFGDLRDRLGELMAVVSPTDDAFASLAETLGWYDGRIQQVIDANERHRLTTEKAKEAQAAAAAAAKGLGGAEDDLGKAYRDTAKAADEAAREAERVAEAEERAAKAARDNAEAQKKTWTEANQFGARVQAEQIERIAALTAANVEAEDTRLTAAQTAAEHYAQVEQQRRNDAINTQQAIQDAAFSAADTMLSMYQEMAAREIDVRSATIDRLQERLAEHGKEMTAQERKNLQERIQAQRRAALLAFGVQKAAAVAQIAINTAQAVMNMLATMPGPAGIAASIAVGITGAAQAAMVASQKPPKLYGGGRVEDRAGDAVPIVAHANEGIVNARGMRALGDQGLDALNRGVTPGGGGGQNVTVVMLDSRVVTTVVGEGLARPGAGRRQLDAVRPRGLGSPWSS
jgi:hypothetical protein